MEEAVELAQAEGLQRGEIDLVSRHVFGRPAGRPNQEAAGVGVTLLAWAAAAHTDLMDLIEGEVARIQSKSAEHFRKRQLAKADAGIAMAPDTVTPRTRDTDGDGNCHLHPDGCPDVSRKGL